MGGVLAFCFAAFMGFESTAIYRGEARDPRAHDPAGDVRLGRLHGVVLLLHHVVGRAGARQRAGPARRPARTWPSCSSPSSRPTSGPGRATLMRILVISSVLASQIAFHNAITRYTSRALRGRRRCPPGSAGCTPATTRRPPPGIVADRTRRRHGRWPSRRRGGPVHRPAHVGQHPGRARHPAAADAHRRRRRRVLRPPVARDRQAVPVVAGARSAVLLAAGTWYLAANLELLTGMAAGQHRADRGRPAGAAARRCRRRLDAPAPPRRPGGDRTPASVTGAPDDVLIQDPTSRRAPRDA